MQEKIKVRDYELIQNIHILFEKPIMILGTGHLGKKICGLLEEIPITVNYIYDKALKEHECMGVPVISFEEVKEVAQKEEYLIVIGTENYREELLSELEKNEVQGYICTWYGVQVAIELNLDNSNFKNNFRNDFLKRKELIKIAEGLTSIFSIFKKIYQYPQAILVWQPRKVGSMTICQTLDSVGINNIHVHVLMSAKKESLAYELQVKNTNYLKEYLNRTSNGLKIITLVREPIGRAISDFMQGFNPVYVERDMDNNILQSVKKYVLSNLESNYEFEWFNKEIKALTNIDIFQYPFDKEKGYAWIKKDNIEILVLKLEKLNQNAEILGKFVGRKNIQIVNENIGEEKHYKYIYDEVRKLIQIPNEILEKQYKDNMQCNHFYSEEERINFMKKWKSNSVNQ